MTYVPIVTPPPTQPPLSPRTRELAGLLTKVVDEYQQAHPKLSRQEVRAAIRMTALTAARGSGGGPRAVVLSLALGILALGLVVGLLFLRGADPGAGEGAVPMIVVAVIAFLGLVAVGLKSLSR